MTLLVGAVSVVLRTVYFPPYFHGWSEVTAEQEIAGWIVNRSRPSKRVEVQLYIDGSFVASGVANLSRPDVLVAGHSKDEWCGYSFKIPALAAGDHVAYVYAVHDVGAGAYRTLQLTGEPLRFTTREDGRLSAGAK